MGLRVGRCFLRRVLAGNLEQPSHGQPLFLEMSSFLFWLSGFYLPQEKVGFRRWFQAFHVHHLAEWRDNEHHSD